MTNETVLATSSVYPTTRHLDLRSINALPLFEKSGKVSEEQLSLVSIFDQPTINVVYANVVLPAVILLWGTKWYKTESTASVLILRSSQTASDKQF